jgi:hypothetical protein
MSYYRLQARAPEPKTKKAAPRFAPPCARNPLWQGLSAALAIMSLYQIHYSNFPQYRGFNTPTIILGLGGASWGVQTLFSCTPLANLGAPPDTYNRDKRYTICTKIDSGIWGGGEAAPLLCSHSWLQFISD